MPLPLWLSSACKPSNVELYVLNSVYLDGNGAELATRGEVGVLSFVTDGDLAVVVGVDDDVGVCANLRWSMAVLVIVGELKSNDKRDLRRHKWTVFYEVTNDKMIDNWRGDVDDSYLGVLTTLVAW